MPAALHRFSTRGLPARERYAAWADRAWPSLAPAFETRLLKPPFEAETESLVLPQLTLTEARMGALAYDRPARLAAGDGVDHLGVCVLLRGEMRGEALGRDWSLRAGGVMLGDFSQAHRWISSESHALTFTIARAYAERVLPAVRELHGTTVSGAAASPFVEPLLALWPHLKSGRTAPDLGAQAVVGLLATIVGRSPVRDEAARPAVQAAQDWRLEALIARHCADPRFDAAALARMAGVSRATLYRMAGPERGVAGLIRAARLERLRAMLEDPQDGRRVSQLAYAAGFADPGAAARAFRAAYGVAPSEHRAQAWSLAGRRPPLA